MVVDVQLSPRSSLKKKLWPSRGDDEVSRLEDVEMLGDGANNGGRYGRRCLESKLSYFPNAFITSAFVSGVAPACTGM